MPLSDAQNIGVHGALGLNIRPYLAGSFMYFALRNFWSIFKEFDDRNQRRLLQFITASDRYPATGIANLSFKITCMGSHDSERFPTSHTCFNQLCLYNYHGREKLRNMLLRAMNESEGFGVK